MDFEFDSDNCKADKKKHGIDSIVARELLADSNPIEITAKTDDEPRFLAVGYTGDKLWPGIITCRGRLIISGLKL